jgi:uncharacterized protein YodC (DUF2158 family)
MIFKKKDLVCYKTNRQQKMIVIETRETFVTCKWMTPSGELKENEIQEDELDCVVPGKCQSYLPQICEFKKGEPIMHITGGPELTIREINEKDVKCSWENELGNEEAGLFLKEEFASNELPANGIFPPPYYKDED